MEPANDTETYRLTQYSHGAGCGCKIAPAVLSEILSSSVATSHDNLLVGNHTRDDAAVLDIGDGRALISTTDFFMPIVDDPFDFGRIAAANAISDVYAMGGKPVLAIAILGWPVDKLPPAVAAKVTEGARAICAEAGIPLAGGHSIDCPEPVFGLAVNGLVKTDHLLTNSGAQVGDLLYLTKPLGIGIITTAQKKGLVSEADFAKAVNAMTTLNRAGELFGRSGFVHALTDVTGFGLLGHLGEMCEGSGVSADIVLESIPALPNVSKYIEMKCVPGGTTRNWKSYGERVQLPDEAAIPLLCDPQTSGGLLAAVGPDVSDEFEALCRDHGLAVYPVGKVVAQEEKTIRVG